MLKEVNLLNVGTAFIDVTPNIGCNLEGWIEPLTSISKSSPIQIKALIIESLSIKYLFLSCDFLEINNTLAKQIKNNINENLQIYNIFIIPTHNHSAQRCNLVNEFLTVTSVALNHLKPAYIKISLIVLLKNMTKL